MAKSGVPKCSVSGCANSATVEARLYDVYPYEHQASVFDEQDFTCPYLCDEHLVENERQAVGERRPRGSVRYPHTNRDGAARNFVFAKLWIKSKFCL